MNTLCLNTKATLFFKKKQQLVLSCSYACDSITSQCIDIAFFLTCCMMLNGARQNVTKRVSSTSNLCSLKKVRTHSSS